jgi:hypothetical protein
VTLLATSKRVVYQTEELVNAFRQQSPSGDLTEAPNGLVIRTSRLDHGFLDECGDGIPERTPVLLKVGTKLQSDGKIT